MAGELVMMVPYRGKRSRVPRTRLLNALSFTAGLILTRVCPFALKGLERLDHCSASDTGFLSVPAYA